MKKEPSFSLHDFKKWLGEHSGETGIVLINNEGLKPGEQVLVRLSEKNMMKKLHPLNEDKKNFPEICSFLKKHGGKMNRIHGPNAEIQVLGLEETVIIPRLFLRRPKKKD